MSAGFFIHRFGGHRPPLQGADIAYWAQESHALAKSAAYSDLEPHDTPSAAYVSNAQRVVRERIALAGCRLAALLNELFK
jgi:hypothetical protein